MRPYWHKGLILLLLGLLAAGCISRPYTLSGEVVTVYGRTAVPDVQIAFSNGFGMAQTTLDGSWVKNDVSGTVTITPAKEGWLFFPSEVLARRSATVRFLAARNLFSRILFTLASDSAADIWVMDPDGSNRTQLTSSGNCDDASWSPDGSKIAFAIRSISESQIWLMNSDGTGKTRIAAQSDYCFSCPSWSPDGAKLVYHAMPGPSHPDAGCATSLYIVDLSDPDLATHELDIPVDGLSLHPARWSPGGEWIAFSGSTGSAIPTKNDIYIIRPDGTGLTRVTSKDAITEQSGFAMLGVRWSPDGQRLVFSAGKEGFDPEPLEIYVINRDGSGLMKLTNTAGSKFCPSWSPDGKKIVFFVSYADGNPNPPPEELYAMNPDGTGLTLLINKAQQPCWSAF